MATHVSAIKRTRQNEKRRVRNLHMKTTVKSLVKDVRLAVEGKDAQAAQKALAQAVPFIRRAQSKGVFHKKNSSRKISRLTRVVNALGKGV